MNADSRYDTYTAQTGSTKLTPAQRRRSDKKANAQSLDATRARRKRASEREKERAARAEHRAFLPN